MGKLSAIETEQKEKRDNADQALEAAKKEIISPEKIQELTRAASNEELKFELVSFVTE